MLGNSAYKAEDYKKAAENYDLAAREMALDTSELYFNRANARVKTASPPARSPTTSKPSRFPRECARLPPT